MNIEVAKKIVEYCNEIGVKSEAHISQDGLYHMVIIDGDLGFLFTMIINNPLKLFDSDGNPLFNFTTKFSFRYNDGTFTIY